LAVLQLRSESKFDAAGRFAPVKQVVDRRQAFSSKELFGHLLILGELEAVLIENLEFDEMIISGNRL